MFLGREAELEALENLYRSGRFEMPVVYGRRRIGKSTLIREFTKNKKTVFFTAFDYRTAARFVPWHSPEEQALVYGVTGGVPKYLELFDEELSADENIVRLFFGRADICTKSRGIS